MNVKNAIKMFAVVVGVGLCLQASSVSAGLVTGEQIVQPSQIDAERLKVQTFIDRAEVRDRLQAFGVAEAMSRVRVAAMTDEEVHAMAQKIDTMPAGGRIHDSDLVVILLIVLLILLI